jgi:hypothetical protein
MMTQEKTLNILQCLQKLAALSYRSLKSKASPLDIGTITKVHTQRADDAIPKEGRT